MKSKRQESAAPRPLPRRMIAAFSLLSALLLVQAPGRAGAGSFFNAPDSFDELAEKASPSVVNIRTVKIIKGGGRVFRHFTRPFGENDPFHDFFDRFFGNEQPQEEFKQRSLGSGFIIDKEGYIVTNNHVIEDADEIQVKLKSGREYDGEIVGRDPNTDMALIKINPENSLPVLAFGDSDALKVGQWVMAIGNPFGLEHTVTAGIVSAKGRVIGSGPYDDFIQTDASINPGNSGGPLLNLEGDVVGINTAIISSGQGIGFAVPVNLAKNVIEQLKSHGEVTRGWLGVAIQDLSGELAEYYNVDVKKGVLVTEVFKGDPADRAGIRAKDIIVEVNGEKIETSRDLTRIIAETRVGSTADVTVLRDGGTKRFDVEIAKREDDRLLSKGPRSEREDALGIRVSEMTPEMAEKFGVPDAEGVVVTGVESGSKGMEAGVLKGDVIKEINHAPIKSVEDYAAAIDKADAGDQINMFIRRMNVGFVVVKLTK